MKHLDAWRAFSMEGQPMPTLRLFIPFVDHELKARQFGGAIERKTNIAAFERHIAEVKAYVPAERLLGWHPSDGWEPLCAFLEVPVPSEPFPHLNSGAGEVKAKPPEATGIEPGSMSMKSVTYA